MDMKFLTMSDFDFNGKKVLLRVDLNSPVINGKIRLNDRIAEHAKTIKELVNKKAKVAILAHQGRPGKEDFLDLRQHAKMLTKLTGKKIRYVDDLYGNEAINKIKNMKSGEAVLLKNVRSSKLEMLALSPKRHSASDFVKTLTPLFDFFIQDAFSVCHRSHASVVGFAYAMPSIAGRVLEKELKSLEKIKKIGKATYILGGAKPEEDLALLKHASKNKILTAGTFCLFCLSAANCNLGKENEILDKNIVKSLKMFMKKSNLFMPIDFVDEDGKEVELSDLPTDKLIFDIGRKTIDRYKKIIKSSKAIFLKGPVGKYEEKKFQFGTKEIFKAVADSKAFSVVGGGNTVDAINRFRIPKNRFSHVSLGGGALISYVIGKKLPGLEVLKKWTE